MLGEGVEFYSGFHLLSHIVYVAPDNGLFVRSVAASKHGTFQLAQETWLMISRSANHHAIGPVQIGLSGGGIGNAAVDDDLKLRVPEF